MLPLTESTPKPLLKVKGESLIETVIDGLKRAGTERIFVVSGYLGEQFLPLEKKYEGLKVLNNPYFEKINNISSVYTAREVLKTGDCLICEADLYLKNRELLSNLPEESCYYGKMIAGHSGDWVFELDGDGWITRVGKGGNDCYNMVGLAYFCRKDAELLGHCIEEAFGEPGHEDWFWDDVVNRNLDRLKLKVRPVESDDIYEVDNPGELEALIGRLGGED